MKLPVEDYYVYAGSLRIIVQARNSHRALVIAEDMYPEEQWDYAVRVRQTTTKPTWCTDEELQTVCEMLILSEIRAL